MKITERRLRNIIRNVINETNRHEELPNDPDLIGDEELMSDILNSARQIPEGIKIKSKKSIKQLKENRDLKSKGLKDFVSGTLDANGKLVALYNLEIHDSGMIGDEVISIGAGSLVASVSHVVNCLSGHGFWVKMFGATMAGGFAALNTVVGLSVALGAVGYWITKKAIKSSHMSSNVSFPDWYEMKQFKRKIGLDEKDLISMSLEELCDKYNISML